jgi:hypothetical protein
VSAFAVAADGAPLERGVGPAGAFVTSLSAGEPEGLRMSYRERLCVPPGSFTLSGPARYGVWTVAA